MIAGWIASLRALMRPPPKVQAAALCLRARDPENRGENEVLLIRSLDSGRWIIPKGWPVKGETLARSAAIEAWEEAGVTGQIGTTAIGRISYDKRLKGGLEEPCEAHVFLLTVEDEARDYPEMALRTRRWFRPEQAAEKVNEADLAALIRRFGL